jgi:hypothetical protein
VFPFPASLLSICLYWFLGSAIQQASHIFAHLASLSKVLQKCHTSQEALDGPKLGTGLCFFSTTGWFVHFLVDIFFLKQTRVIIMVILITANFYQLVCRFQEMY